MGSKMGGEEGGIGGVWWGEWGPKMGGEEGRIGGCGGGSGV